MTNFSRYNMESNVIRQKYSQDEIIVIIPGSSDFKFGIALNKNPISVPSLFAVKLKPAKKKVKFRDDMLIPNSNVIKNNRNKIIYDVLEKKIYKRYVHIPTEEQIKNEEKYSKEDTTKENIKSNDLNKNFIKTDQFIYGKNVFDLSEDYSYEIIEFFKNGVLNFETVSETILKNVICEYIKNVVRDDLGISEKKFNKYCIAFGVPLSFCKTEMLFFTEIFLNKIGFKSLFLYPEPVLACFGTGFSGACIVDIGSQSSKICCVQYGSVVTQSKIVIPFGGKDITELLLHNLISEKFNEFYSPIKTYFSSLNKRELAIKIKKMKEEVSIFPSDSRPVRNFLCEFEYNSNKKFELKNDIKTKIKMKMTLSNSIILCSLGLFEPKMLRSYYLKERGFKLHEIDLCRFEYERTLLMFQQTDNKNCKIKFKKIGLTKAITESILTLTKSEDQMSMATSLLLIGGTANIPGISDYIEEDLKKEFKSQNSIISNVEILPRRDEADSGLSPEFCSWLGMAIICANEGCKEMWITNSEWKKAPNIFTIRKKLPFDIDMDVLNNVNQN